MQHSVTLIISNPRADIDILRLLQSKAAIFAQYPIRVLRCDNPRDMQLIVSTGATRSPAIVRSGIPPIIGRQSVAEFIIRRADELSAAMAPRDDREETSDFATVGKEDISKKIEERARIIAEYDDARRAKKSNPTTAKGPPPATGTPGDSYVDTSEPIYRSFIQNATEHTDGDFNIIDDYLQSDARNGVPQPITPPGANLERIASDRSQISGEKCLMDFYASLQQ